ncbi:MAG: C4-type zinc ribbon domain-containing protein [Candidatus Sumerlaeia bacterium]|nr:C4-type zinc ribbon domain-containing protein [Candidatus Sumerlaeia bacterium]
MNKNNAKYESKQSAINPSAFMAKLKPEVQLLIQIQELDKASVELKKTINSLPAKIVQLETQVNQEQQKLEALKKKKEELLKRHHQAELELKAREQQLKKLHAQEVEVKTNEAYRALQHEIDQVEKEIDSLEETIILILEEEDGIKKQIVEQTARIEAERKRAGEEKVRLETEIQEKKSQYAELVARRDSLVAQLPEQLKEFYHTFHERYLGEMVVPVVHGSCKGCFMQIIPHRLVQIHLGEELVFCDKCQRLLAYDADFNPESSTQENQ